MSRVGNKIINVPEGVTVDIAADNTVTVTGAKGTLVRQFSPVITIKNEDNVITVSRSSEQKTHKQLHGTTRALLANMIEGVHVGFKKELEIVETPGHDIDCLSYQYSRFLFTGDSYIPFSPVYAKWKRSDKVLAKNNESFLKNYAEMNHLQVLCGHYE